MKVFRLIGFFVVVLGFCSCGGAEDSSTKSGAANSPKAASAGSGERAARYIKVKGTPRPPKITVPPGPPPGRLIVKDLKIGLGPFAHPGKKVRVNYIGIDYKTGKPFEKNWGNPIPFIFNFGSGETIDGWEIGLKGMRVGGRRELIVPSHLGFGNGPLIYVVELLQNE